jgi:hypothetical protein
VALPSVKARAGSWHDAQATVPSADSRGSKNSFSPRAIFTGLCGLSSGASAKVCRSGRPSCLRDRGCAERPGTGTDGRLAVAVAGLPPEVSDCPVCHAPSSIPALTNTSAVVAKAFETLIRGRAFSGESIGYPITRGFLFQPDGDLVYAF